MSKKLFPQIQVTTLAYELVQDLEAAHYAFSATPKEDEDKVAYAYAVLCYRRKALYNYIESLERGNTPTPYETRTAVRFD